MRLFVFTLPFCLAIVGLSLALQCTALDECFGNESGRQAAYKQIDAVLAARDGATWEKKLNELSRWHEEELKINQGQDACLLRIVEDIVKLRNIKSLGGCTDDNLKAYQAVVGKDREIDVTRSELNALERFVNHYREVYDQGCVAQFNRLFDGAVSGITREDLALVKTFGRYVAYENFKVATSLRAMGERLRNPELNKLEMSKSIKSFNKEDLVRACKVYSDSLSKDFFERVISHSEAMHWIPSSSLSFMIGFSDWETCQALLQQENSSAI